MVLQVQVTETFRVGALLVQASMGGAGLAPSTVLPRPLSDDENAATVRSMLGRSLGMRVSCIEGPSGPNVRPSERSVYALMCVDGRRFQFKIRTDAIGIMEVPFPVHSADPEWT